MYGLYARTTCGNRVYYRCSTYELQVYRLYTCVICVIHVYYMCSTYVVHVYDYMCNTPKTPHMYYTYNQTCNTHVAHALMYVLSGWLIDKVNHRI